MMIGIEVGDGTGSGIFIPLPFYLTPIEHKSHFLNCITDA